MQWDFEFGLLTAHVAHLHASKTRKGNKNGLKTPYIIHPLQVLQKVQDGVLLKTQVKIDHFGKAYFSMML